MSPCSRRYPVLAACLDDFNAQDLVNTAWAFAKLGHFDQSLFAAVARRFRDSGAMNDDQLSAQFIANVAWAFSKASEAGKLEQATSEELFRNLATAAEASVADFTAADLANVAWAFANAIRWTRPFSSRSRTVPRTS